MAFHEQSSPVSNYYAIETWLYGRTEFWTMLSWPRNKILISLLIMKVLSVGLSASFCYFLPLKTIYSPRRHTLTRPRSLLRAKNKVTHSQKQKTEFLFLSSTGQLDSHDEQRPLRHRYCVSSCKFLWQYIYFLQLPPQQTAQYTASTRPPPAVSRNMMTSSTLCTRSRFMASSVILDCFLLLSSFYYQGRLDWF